MAGIDDIASYFTDPYRDGYTVSKTAVFALIFVVGAYAMYELLKRLKIKVDRRLAIAVAPFVLLGSTLRVLVDAGTISEWPYNILLTTPNSWLVIAAFTLGTLAISVFLERHKKIPYHKVMFAVGVVSVALAMAFLRPVNLYGILLSATFVLPWLLLAVFFKKWNLWNRLALLAQMVDANVTFVTLNFFGTATTFGYVEQHVLPNFFIGLLGPFSFIVIKAVVIIAALVLVDRLAEDKNFGNYIKLIIGILGAATGLRDFLRLAAFV